MTVRCVLLLGESRARALAEYWDGTDWRTVPTADPGIRAGAFAGVTALSATDVWAVGYSREARSAPLTEHWDGPAWNVIPAPSPAPGSGAVVLGGVAARGPRDVWAVGQYRKNKYGQTTSFSGVENPDDVTLLIRQA